MRKYILIILIAVSAVISLLSYTETPPITETAFVESENYTVKEHFGKIGIFEEGAQTPLTVLDVYVFTLPEADRILLSEGFTVDRSSLQSVIEDYTG